MPLKKLEIIYFNAGGGHRSTALALEAVLQNRYEVVLTNLFDIIDPKKLFRKITRYDHEDLYNKVLASGFTFGLGPQLKVLQAVIMTQRESFTKKLRSHWKQTHPDLVVSVIPNFNYPIGISLSCDFVTIITDLADNPPHFWVEPELKNQHIICGTEMAAAQAIVAGVNPERVHRVSGMMLRPAFYESLPKSNTLIDEPVGLVMFGGIGSRDMIPIAKKLTNRRLILVCGKNAALEKKLSAVNNPLHAVKGFVDDMPQLMADADYLIGKPGPGTISEAAHMRLPVIVSLNTFTMPQERWNCEWILQKNIGLVVPAFNKIDRAVGTLIDDLSRMKANMAKIHNRAIFEIPELLDRHL